MKTCSNTSRSKCKPVLILLFFILLSVAVFLTYRFLTGNAAEKRNHPILFENEVERYAERFEVPKEIVYAVILTESSFDPSAVSSADAKGLMQLTDDTNEYVTAYLLKEEITEGDLFDPETNIRRGTCLLGYLYGRFGNWETAYAAYNAGIGRVLGWLSDPAYSSDGEHLDKIPFEETDRYVRKVARAAESYRKLYFADESETQN